VAGAPTIVGAWLGGCAANDVLAALFFGAAAGAAFEVVAEVVRYVGKRDPAGLRSGYAIGGFLAGIAVMYVTGLLAA
jgi:zinc transporter, ZIP family